MTISNTLIGRLNHAHDRTLLNRSDSWKDVDAIAISEAIDELSRLTAYHQSIEQRLDVMTERVEMALVMVRTMQGTLS